MRNELALIFLSNFILLNSPVYSYHSFDAALVNYFVLLFLSIITILKWVNSPVKFDFNWQIGVFFVIVYFVLGVFSAIYNQLNPIDAFIKLIVLASGFFVYFYLIYPKLNRTYVALFLEVVFYTSIFHFLLSLLFLNDPDYMTPNASLGQVFSGFGFGNIYITFGYLLIFSTAYLFYRPAPFVYFLYLIIVFAYAYIAFQYPLRSLYYFAFILFLGFFFIGKYRIFLLAFFALSLSFIPDYVISKTLNESRLLFFNDLSSYTDCYIFGCGFGVLQHWVVNHPYSLADINVLIILLLEVGVYALIPYLFLIYMFISSIYKYSRDSSLYYLFFYFCALGGVFFMPQGAPLAQLSIYEYHLALLFIISILKFANNPSPTSNYIN